MVFRRFLRNLFIVLLVAAIFAAVGYYISREDLKNRIAISNEMITQAVSTAIRDALYNATRTAEADEPHYIMLKVGSTDSLLAVAEKYDTTIDVLRMANNLLPTVDFGDGTEIVITRGVKQLVPPRRFKTTYIAQYGDDLASVAARNNIAIEILAQDNPILAKRGLNPGDLVFIPELL